MADTAITTYVYVNENANSTTAAITLAAKALSRMTQTIDTMLNSRVDLKFKTPAEMKAGGATLSDGSAAWGYTFATVRECWINTSPNGNYLGSEKVQYTILHELGHMVDHDKLSSTERATLMGIMNPVATSWGQGTYINHPSECFGDQFPRVWSDIDGVLVGYYGRQIATADYGTYRTAITGATGPTPMTLVASAPIGSTNIKVSSVVGLAVDDWIEIGTASPEQAKITAVGTTGTGGTGVSFTPATTVVHSSGAAFQEIAAPDPGGTGGSAPSYSITISGGDWTTQIPAESIRLSETGSDSAATFEFTIETHPHKSLDTPLPVSVSTGSEFPYDTIIFNDLNSGWRFFGGVLVGVTRRHLTGGAIAQDCRAISYDSWLDRRYLQTWWTTDTGTSTGVKLADDRLIVQRIVKDGVSWLTADNTYVKSTNTSMPKLNLTDGTVRAAILAVAEAATTVADPTTRRVYVDFHQRVHYFKGDEATTAPYRVGDASYADTIKATTGLISFWPMNDASGQLVDAKGVKNMTLTGNAIRGVTGGVINEPGKGGIYFAGVTSGTLSSASYHPGNVLSLECWYRREVTGSQQTLFDAGTGDYSVEFQADDTIRVFKRGTGADFITTATFTGDGLWHHMVVTHSATTTHVYIDGVDKAGTATFKTFVPTTNALFFGAANDLTSKFNGSLQDIAFYNVALSQATVTAHYNDGVTLVPDYIDFDTDYNDSVGSVYIRGANSAGTGWSTYSGTRSPYGANTIIDRDDSDSASTKAAVETAYLKRDGYIVAGGHITISGYDGWRAGQTITIDDASLSINGTYEIKYLETTVSGTTDLTYDIYYGSMPWRGTFDIQRKHRRGNMHGA